MKKYFSFIVLLLFTSINSFSQTVGLIQHTANSLDDGYVLFAPIGSTTSYLIDKCGKQVKIWNSAYRPAQSVYLLQDGTLLRPASDNSTTFVAGGKGGIIEKIDWSGNVTWTYSISDVTKCQHHDVKALPNGNILVIAWESKTNAQAIAEGRNPSLVPATLWSEQILEIQPVGANGGNIVWEWHLWDHLIQDFDNTKPNFGTVSATPQLINLNYKASATQSDWIHLNSIDYNPVLDQILISSHAMSEIWIIDHSTSSAQSASHAGGNSNKGGDILYRWGNPAAYNNGVLADQKFFGQHNAHWIESGLPYANEIMVFNNGLNRTGGNYSTVEIINPPALGYNYTASLPYLPTANSWIYNAGNTNNYYAQNISGAQQLANGNVLLCNGPLGLFTEIDSMGIEVWKYVSPVGAMGAIIQQNTIPSQNLVFRCSFYPSSFSGFSGQTLVAGNTIENTNIVSTSCNLTTDVVGNFTDNQPTLFPNPARHFINVDCKNGYKIFSIEGRLLRHSSHDTQIIDVSELPNGMFILKSDIKVTRFIKSE